MRSDQHLSSAHSRDRAKRQLHSGNLHRHPPSCLLDRTVRLPVQEYEQDGDPTYAGKSRICLLSLRDQGALEAILFDASHHEANANHGACLRNHFLELELDCAKFICHIQLALTDRCDGLESPI